MKTIKSHMNEGRNHKVEERYANLTKEAEYL
jgi:hypothetical protein